MLFFLSKNIFSNLVKRRKQTYALLSLGRMFLGYFKFWFMNVQRGAHAMFLHWFWISWKKDYMFKYITIDFFDAFETWRQTLAKAIWFDKKYPCLIVKDESAHLNTCMQGQSEGASAWWWRWWMAFMQVWFETIRFWILLFVGFCMVCSNLNGLAENPWCHARIHAFLSAAWSFGLPQFSLAYG